MKTIKFRSALDFVFPDGTDRPRRPVPAPKSSALAKVYDALWENIIQVKSLACLPSNLISVVQWYQEIQNAAMASLTGSVFLELGNAPSADALIAEGQRIASERTQSRDDKLTVDFAFAAADLFEQIVNLSPNPTLASAVKALYAALLIGSYTTFESLSTDLWITAVNFRPRSLAKNVLDPGNDGGPSIKYAILSEHDFNVQKKMGELLKESSVADFQSFRRIEMTYKKTFKVPENRKGNRANEGSSNALSQIFQGGRDDILVLESIRNLLAHRGGIVDQPFLNEIQKRSPLLYQAVQKDKPLEIDGEMISKYAGSAIGFSVSLFAFVDDWLVKYSE